MVIWLMGLAGSGKSTLGRALYEKLKDKGISNLVYLDGDEFREVIGDFGYDKNSRIEIAKKRAKLCQMFSSQGIIVIASSISMFQENYDFNRKVIKNYFEVYVQCGIGELKRRNQKGLYSGEIKDVVGVDICIDDPSPDLTLRSECDKIKENLNVLFYKVSSLLTPMNLETYDKQSNFV